MCTWGVSCLKIQPRKHLENKLHNCRWAAMKPVLFLKGKKSLFCLRVHVNSAFKFVITLFFTICLKRGGHRDVHRDVVSAEPVRPEEGKQCPSLLVA